MAGTFGENWNAFEGIIMNATYNIVAVIALSCFFIINIIGSFDTADGVVEAWVASNFSAEYLFTALLIALIVGEIYRVQIGRAHV